MKRYNDFINEELSVRDAMKPKTKDEIIKILDGLSDNEKIKKIIYTKLPYDLLPRDENGVCNLVGDLDCRWWKLVELPVNLTISGHLDCRDNNLTSLPDNLTIGKFLDCSGNILVKLSDNLNIIGSLDCSNNKVKVELPSTAKVGGWFYN